MSKKLYTILGVQQSATPGEIKKAYHQQALASHPDKVGEAGTERFKEVKRAYDILSDAPKRQLYDRVGDSGMELVEGNGMGGAVAHPLFGVVVSIFVWLVSFLLLLFTIFIVLKVDGQRSEWNWATVFSPIWILDTTFLCGMCGVIQGMCQNFEWKMLLAATALVLGFISPILIVAGLEGHTSSWSATLSPVFILSGLNLLSSANGISLTSFRQSREVQGDDHAYSYLSPLYLLHVVSSLINMAYGVTFWALVCNRVDSTTVPYSYWVAFSPVFAYSAMSFFVIIVTTYVDMPRRMPDAGCGNILCVILTSSIFLSVPVTFFVLLAAKLEGSGTTLGVVCVPLFIVLGVLVLMSMCMCCVACVQSSASSDPSAEEDPLHTGAGTSPGNSSTPYAGGPYDSTA